MGWLLPSLPSLGDAGGLFPSYGSKPPSASLHPLCVTGGWELPNAAFLTARPACFGAQNEISKCLFSVVDAIMSHAV